MTKQRQVIYDTIMDAQDHLTADEIYDRVRSVMPGLARGTVYRNLGLMERDGQVRRVRIAGEADRFDRALEPHEHAICPICGSLHDFAFPGLVEQVEAALGRPADKVELNVRAVCALCAGKRAM